MLLNCMPVIRRIKPIMCETKGRGGRKIWNKMKIKKVNDPIFGSILPTSPIQMVDTEAFYCKEQSSCLEINRPNNRFEMPVCGWGAVFFCLLYDVSLHRKPFKWQLFFLDQLQEISETTARERCNKEARTNTQMCHLLFLSGTSDAISSWPPPPKKKNTNTQTHTN